MSDLLPCPFCGGEARLITGQHNFVDAQVSCLDCGMSGPDFDHDPAIGAFSDDPSADAAKHWNTRHKAANDHDALVKALDECVRSLIAGCREKNIGFDPRSCPADSTIGQAIAILDAVGAGNLRGAESRDGDK